MRCRGSAAISLTRNSNQQPQVQSAAANPISSRKSNQQPQVQLAVTGPISSRVAATAYSCRREPAVENPPDPQPRSGDSANRYHRKTFPIEFDFVATRSHNRIRVRMSVAATRLAVLVGAYLRADARSYTLPRLRRYFADAKFQSAATSPIGSRKSN